jgi:hypothetical protein
MNTGSARVRNSRWSDAPVLDKSDRPKVAAISDRDITGIFMPLVRYRYLPADYVHAFAGGNFDYLIDRLNVLSRRPNLYLARPHQQRANAGANHRRLIYELAEKGIALMRERGFPVHRTRAPGSFAHELMTCLIMASLELGSRESSARLIGWSDILASQSLPEATRQSPKPYHSPVSAVINGHRWDTHIAADAHPFGIERVREGRRSYFFCPGIEADCGSEPIDASDFQRSSLYKKFVLYLAVEAQGIHRTHFGFPNLYIPFVTTTVSRLASMMALLERITGGAGARQFLFKTFPAFTSYEKPPPPSGHMLTEDWARVGYPPFNFLSS